jgi:Putative zinc-finger
MTCFSAKRKSTAYLDHRLRDKERARLQEHLRGCDPCASYFDQLGWVRHGLQQLPKPLTPGALRTKLMVLASRERQDLKATAGSRFQLAWENWKFRVNEWMRPLTIPATGGILSSLVLCATFAFAVGTSARSVAYEVPVEYEDHAAANLVPLNMRSSVLLNISLDGRGHIQDYMARNASDQVTGDAGGLASHDISLPEFPAPAIAGDISILVTPIVYRQ